MLVGLVFLSIGKMKHCHQKSSVPSRCTSIEAKQQDDPCAGKTSPSRISTHVIQERNRLHQVPFTAYVLQKESWK
jgi:hypothetical protein